jgi:hypothetical protein
VREAFGGSGQLLLAAKKPFHNSPTVILRLFVLHLLLQGIVPRQFSVLHSSIRERYTATLVCI